jgi:ubiquitin-conjugating enzyme (huntingtin interacting protein 2)
LTIKSTLLSLQSLFESPEPKDPQDAEVAKMLMTDPDAFNHKAHEWAVQYAGAPSNPKFSSVKPRSTTAAQKVVDDEKRWAYGKGFISCPFKTGWTDFIADTAATTGPS